MILAPVVLDAIAVCDVQRELVVMKKKASSTFARWNCYDLEKNVRQI